MKRLTFENAVFLCLILLVVICDFTVAYFLFIEEVLLGFFLALVATLLAGVAAYWAYLYPEEVQIK